MVHDSLKALIEQADVHPPAGDMNPAELAGRVRAVYRWRRRRRLAVVAAAVLLLGGVLWPALSGRQGGEPVTLRSHVAVAPEVTIAHPQRSLRETAEQVQREEHAIDSLLAAERAGRLAKAAEAARNTSRWAASRDEQVGPAAASYLVSADHKRQAGQPAASAREDYARVIELFPDTVWADQAKACLAANSTPKNHP
jgi:hypothetical protein